MTRPNGNAQRNPYVVQPVFKALKVLEYVARQGHDVTLTEVASELALPKTTAFRYLQTLTVAAFLSHDQAHDRYGLGSRFHALANADTSLRRLRDVAHPMMEDLGRSFNETINLGILADRHIVDGAVNAVGWVAQESSYWFRRFQTGLVQNYALLMLFGVFVFVGVYLFVR